MNTEVRSSEAAVPETVIVASEDQAPAARTHRARWAFGTVAAILLIAALAVAFVQTRTAGSQSQTVELKFGGHGDLANPPWTITTGHWQQSEGTAFASAVAPGWTLTAIDRGVADGTVSTTFDAHGSEAGLAFRVRDTSNFWTFTASSRYGTWNISKVVGGNLIFVANTGLTRTSGRHLIAARMSGSFIDVSIDGHGVASIDDTDLQSATGAGLVTLRTKHPKTARWDGLTATFGKDGPRFAKSAGD